MLKRICQSDNSPRLFGGLAVLAIAIAIIGCGGGGGGTGTGGGSTTGGVLPSNVLLYSTTPDSGATLNVMQVNADGTGKTQVASLSPAFEGFAFNPAVKKQVVFGYSPSGTSNPVFGIYRNNSGSASGTGAAMIVSAQYSYVSSVQVSSDGKFVYYVAATGTNDTQLFRVSIGGGAVKTIDFAYSAQVNDAGDSVVYDKIPTGGTTSQVFTAPADGTGPPTAISTDVAHNYQTPQWSKDGKSIVVASDKDNSMFEIYVMAPTSGAAMTQVSSLANVDKSQGATLSPDGTMASFIGLGADTALTGVYRTVSFGTKPITQTQIVVDPNVLSGVYWTGSNGRAVGDSNGFVARRKHHGLIP